MTPTKAVLAVLNGLFIGALLGFTVAVLYPASPLPADPGTVHVIVSADLDAELQPTSERGPR